MRRIGRRQEVAQQATVEQHGILQAQLNAKLVDIAQRDFRNEYLDHDLRRLFVELFDEFADFLEVPRSGRQHEFVGHGFRDHDDFAFELLKGALLARSGLLDLPATGQELIDRVRDIDGG